MAELRGGRMIKSANTAGDFKEAGRDMDEV